MRRSINFITLGCVILLAGAAQGQTMPDAATDAPAITTDAAKPAKPPKAAKPPKDPQDPADTAPKQVDVSADQSLEWYQDQRIYVARGNAKAIRGDTVIQADILTAHEREKPTGPDGKKLPKPPVDKTANGGKDQGTGDIDKMTAEGNVRITDPKQRVTGEHAVYDLDQHVAVLTGNNLTYETEKETVTAKDSLEYWEDKKIAVARGDAVAVQGDRHITGDVLTAEFKDVPAEDGSGGTQQKLTKLSVVGHAVIVTKVDVSRGDKAVYDQDTDVAVITGHVRITRGDGTQLSGDMGEMDMKTNESRLLNQGTGRVRALLTSSTTDKANAAGGTTAKTPKPAKTVKTPAQTPAQQALDASPQ